MLHRSAAGRSTVVLGLVLLATACGKAPAKTAEALPASTAAPAGSAAAPGPSAGPLTLPKTSAVARSFATSTRFSQKSKAAACAAPVAEGDPRQAIASAEKGCASAGLKPVGAVFSGSVTGAGAAAEWPVELDAGRCYRVVAAGGKNVRFLTVMVRDADGAIAAEGVGEAPSAGAPTDAVLCPRQKERVVVLVASGAGDGPAAARLFAE